jgi:pimeloyl-ACP methyl ester carboxylesterase
VPLLLVQGGASPGAMHRPVARFAASVPQARVATIDGTHHLLPLTHPDEFAGLVASGFVERAA